LAVLQTDKFQNATYLKSLGQSWHWFLPPPHGRYLYGLKWNVACQTGLKMSSFLEDFILIAGC